MYFNHQLHYSVSSTASSTREIVFFLDLFYFQSIENSVDNFCWYGKRDRKRKHIKNESCPTTFLRQSREFLAGMGATPHISFCLSFLSKAKWFFFLHVKRCYLLTWVQWIFKQTRARLHIQEWNCNEIWRKYKRSIVVIPLDSTPNPETLAWKGEGEGGGRRRVT